MSLAGLAGLRNVFLNLTRHRGYRPALITLVVVVGLGWSFSRLFGPTFPGLFFIYLMALLAGAWWGYGPGIVVTLLIVYAAPYSYKPSFTARQVPLSGVAVFLLVSLTVSRISATRARSERNLRLANDELEERVRVRTVELESANAALQQRLAELETLYGKLSAGLTFLDTELRFVRVNEALATINGVAPAEHIGRGLREILPPDIADAVEPIFRRVLETGEPNLDYEVHGPSPNRPGSEADWLVACSPVKTEEGAALGVQVIVQDITERKRFDDKLRHTAKLESLGVLAGGIAHDFNNLLTGILGNASLAQDTVSPAHPAYAMLDDVVKASERAADLTRQLLAYAGKGRFVIEPLSLSGLIADIQPLIGTALKGAAEVRLELHDQGCSIYGDTSQLQQLIMNLD